MKIGSHFYILDQSSLKCHTWWISRVFEKVERAVKRCCQTDWIWIDKNCWKCQMKNSNETFWIIFYLTGKFILQNHQILSFRGKFHSGKSKKYCHLTEKSTLWLCCKIRANLVISRKISCLAIWRKNSFLSNSSKHFSLF